MKREIEKFAEIIRSSGYKLTPQRRVVLDVLLKNRGNPLTPEIIYGKVKKFHSGLGLTTVYRTLELLGEMKIVNHIHFHKGTDRYEINHRGHHHYLICLNCGKAEMKEFCLFTEMQEKFKDMTNFRVTEHCFSFFGYCEDCQTKI